MSEWKEINFGEIATFRNGLNFKNDSQGKGCKIIGIPDFGDKLIPDYESLGEINPNGVVKKEDYLQIGDIIFVRSNGNKNLVGRSLYISQISKPMVYSGFCIRARINTEQANPLFLAYFFRTTLFRKMISGAAGGANIQNLNQGLLNRSIIPLPSIKTQKRIASILSTYDDLIENNLKRIKLLEELAQRTYEEWFVKFRINGKQLEVGENGLPEGWEYLKIDNLLEKIKSSGKTLSTEISSFGKFPVVDQSRDFIAGYINDEDKLVKSNKPIIIFGDHTRILKFINFPFVRGADGTQVLLSNNEKMPQHLFYQSLLKVDLSNYHYARHFKFLKECEVLLPTINFANEYESLIKPKFDLINNLRTQNRLLKESRDILLPRLMSGKIEVGKEVMGMVAEESEKYN